MKREDTRKKINEAIKEVIKVFQKKPHFFFNEEDVKAYLYSELLDKFKDVDDGKKTTSIHCNIVAGSGIVPDLSICDVDSFTPPTYDEWGFDEESAISIEIKYCIKNESKNKILKKLWNPEPTKEEEKGDYYKLLKNEEYGSIALIFDHKGHLKKEDLISLQKQNNDKDTRIKIVYVTPSEVICVMNSDECSLFD